jgi:hypothetical protein
VLANHQIDGHQQKFRYLLKRLENINKLYKKLKIQGKRAEFGIRERSKASIQQKWNAIFQKYRDIKDTIACTRLLIIKIRNPSETLLTNQITHHSIN